MSGHWLKLNDVHVRCDREYLDVRQTWAIADALRNLFDVPSIIDPCHCECACNCGWPSRDYGNYQPDTTPAARGLDE